MQIAEDHAVVDCFCLGDRCLGTSQLRIAIHHELDSRTLCCVELLGYVCQDQLRGTFECTRVRLQLTEYQGQQARLAGAVGAYDADLLAAMDRERGILDQKARTAA